MTKLSSKTVKNFVDRSMGFPIVLPEVELRQVAGHWAAVFNQNRVAAATFRALFEAHVRYSGAQIQFIRGEMGLTQGGLAALMGLDSHVQVSRWEKKRQELARISPIHEANLRLVMRSHLGLKTFSIQEHLKLLAGGIKDPRGPLVVDATG